MTNSRTISIIGCGWLGLPLAKHLVNEGWQTKGTVTSNDKLAVLKQENITPFKINLNNGTDHIDLSFFESEYLLVNIPPSKLSSAYEQYNKLCQLIAKSSVEKIIFISSTSVYNNNGIFKEEDTENLPDTTNVHLSFERLFQRLNKKVIIVRFAGLIGPLRHPGRFFTSNKPLTNPHAPVNLIHLDDCIGIITTLLNKGKWGEIFNGCANTHPSRYDFYGKAASLLGHSITASNASAANNSNKTVSNTKIISQLGYSFKYPDLMVLLDKAKF